MGNAVPEIDDVTAQPPPWNVRYSGETLATQEQPDMTTMDNVRERAGDAKEQIEKLRQQVESLMSERVSPALHDAAGRAEAAARSGMAMARDQKEAVSSRVREQPMVAIVIAGVAGFLLGRLFR